MRVRGPTKILKILLKMWVWGRDLNLGPPEYEGNSRKLSTAIFDDPLSSNKLLRFDQRVKTTRRIRFICGRTKH